MKASPTVDGVSFDQKGTKKNSDLDNDVWQEGTN